MLSQHSYYAIANLTFVLSDVVGYVPVSSASRGEERGHSVAQVCPGSLSLLPPQPWVVPWPFCAHSLKVSLPNFVERDGSDSSLQALHIMCLSLRLRWSYLLLLHRKKFFVLNLDVKEAIQKRGLFLDLLYYQVNETPADEACLASPDA